MCSHRHTLRIEPAGTDFTNRHGLSQSTASGVTTVNAGGDSGTGSLSSGSSDGSGPVASVPLTLANGSGGGGGGSGARGSGGNSGGHVIGIGPEGTPVAASTSSTQHSAAQMVRCFLQVSISIFHLLSFKSCGCIPLV